MARGYKCCYWIGPTFVTEIVDVRSPFDAVRLVEAKFAGNPKFRWSEKAGVYYKE